MPTTRFVHAADLHLDTPFEGIGQTAPEVAALLRDASLVAWDALVQLCIDEKAEFLLLAGDIYDGEVRGVRAQLRFLRGLERLASRGIEVFIAHGNHDPAGGRWSAIREWPRGVTVFGHERVESVRVDRDGRTLAVVHGLSHSTREVSENLALRFRRGSEDCPHLAVLHCNAGRDPGHALYSPCTLDDLRAAGMDYWALGHIHAYRVLFEGDLAAVYAGSLQGRSLKPSERGLKGAVVGTIEDGRVAGWRFVPVPHVRFIEFVVDVTNISDVGRLVARLEENVAAELQAGSCSGLVARARLVGRGPVHTDLDRPGAPDELLTRLREEATGREPLVWWSALMNETRADLDRDGIRARGDFSAELIRLTDSLRADENRLASFIDEKTGDLWTPTLQQSCSVLSAEMPAVLDEAEMLVLEKLESRDGQ